MTAFTPEEEALFELKVQDETQVLRIRREARRRVDIEDELVADLDALYLDREALKHLPLPAQLIPGVIPRHAYGVLRGRDQSFKSFVALDWALTLATGRFWGFEPVQRVPVLYVAGEGAWGLAARIDAWEQAHSTQVDSAWFTVRQAALNLHSPGPAFDHLLEHVQRRFYGLVVVDTLRRVSGAADGNGSEMGAVIDNLDQIKRATADGTVLVVAHTDKGDNDSRGYSGIEDDADFVWHARRDGDDLELALTKMKDGPDGMTTHMKAWPKGDSMVLHPATKPTAARESTEGDLKVLATLREVFPNGARKGELVATADVSRATVYRSLQRLLDRGLVVDQGSETRPLYVAKGLAESPDGLAPHLPVISAQSHQVSPQSQEVSPVSRPLGSETDETRHLTDEQRTIIERAMKAPEAEAS